MNTYQNYRNKYTPQQVEALRRTSMRDILAAEGYDTSHTPSGLFFSPFRAREAEPSLHIDDTGHRWFDFGDPLRGAEFSRSGKGGGDTIAFVRALKGFSYIEALDYLSRYNPSVVPMLNVKRIRVPRIKDRIIMVPGGAVSATQTRIIESRERFTDRGLVRYAESRGIPRDILEKVCREVSYEVEYVDSDGVVHVSEHVSIGFHNSGDGWVLRYPSKDPKRGKRNAGRGAPTLFGHDGTVLPLDARAKMASVVVFEGFMDYMSWLAMKRPDGVPGDCDAVVLNSVANLVAAEPFLLSHRVVLGLLDADRAGEAATDALKMRCVAGGVRFLDQRRMLQGCKDFNEMWQKCAKDWA